jgi:hypothetical protein
MSLADFQQFASLLGLTIAPPSHGTSTGEAGSHLMFPAKRPTRLKKFTPITILLYKPKIELFSGRMNAFSAFRNVGLGPSEGLFCPPFWRRPHLDPEAVLA